jgi:hypothetical protein
VSVEKRQWARHLADYALGNGEKDSVELCGQLQGSTVLLSIPCNNSTSVLSIQRLALAILRKRRVWVYATSMRLWNNEGYQPRTWGGGHGQYTIPRRRQGPHSSLDLRHSCVPCQENITITTKEQILQAIRALPDDATVEDAMERLDVLSKVERGLAQADTGQKVSQEEARIRMARWLM